MNKKELIIELKKINIELNENQLKQIDDFWVLLSSENQKYNLTAIKTYEDYLLKHVYDSLTLYEKISDSDYKTLLDIGSGAGFPGIILKIAKPSLDITLLDSNNKKTTFLTKAKELLNLNDLHIINDRAESFVKNKRESFDLVTARAVAKLDVLIELAVPFLKINGTFIAMKANVEEEMNQGIIAAEVLGAKLNSTEEIRLPIENSVRTLITVTKLSKTNLEYPRPYDRIIKKPLKISKK